MLIQLQVQKMSRPVISQLCRLLTVLAVIFYSPCQGQTAHTFLLENCGWPSTSHVPTTRGNSSLLKAPRPQNHNLAPNLRCRTRFYINSLSHHLLLTVKMFSLFGPDECTSTSERFMIQFSQYSGLRNITWCGNLYAEEILLPVSAVDVLYNTGSFGEGAGFEIVFQAALLYECYYKTRLQARLQPRFLYSPNYPGRYHSLLTCEVHLYVEDGQYIHVQSVDMALEGSRKCEYDALSINNASYCGKQPIDVLVNSSNARLRFKTDAHKTARGFKLKYSAVQPELIKCNGTEIRLTANTMETVLVLQDVPESRSSQNKSSICVISLDSGSEDKVLALTLPKDMGAFSHYEIRVHKEDGYEIIFNETQGPRPCGKGEVTTLHFLRTPNRKAELKFHLKGKQSYFRIQAVEKVALPKSIQGDYSMIWINRGLQRQDRRTLPPEMLIRAQLEVHKHLEVGVIDGASFTSSMRGREYRLRVAGNLEVYNGEDSSYFELTRDCRGSLRQDGISIYSFQTEHVTVRIRQLSRDTTSGFWLYIGPCDHNPAPYLNTISLGEIFTTRRDSKIVHLKNLHCQWVLSHRDQIRLTNRNELVRLKAESNFPVNNAQNSFKVNDGKSLEMSINTETRRDLWLYSPQPLIITVSIFSMQQNQQSLYFQFTYQRAPRLNGKEPLICKREYLKAKNTTQYAVTPYYPNFFKSNTCEWVIKRDSSVNRHVIVQFPNVTQLPGSGSSVVKFEIYRNYGENSFTLDCYECDTDLRTRSFYNKDIMVRLVTEPSFVQPGLRLTYFSEEVCSNSPTFLEATTMDSFLSSPNYPEYYPDNVKCRWQIWTANPNTAIYIEFLDFHLAPESYSQCNRDYLKIYDGPAENYPSFGPFCGSIAYKELVSTTAYFTVVFKSDLGSSQRGFRFVYRSQFSASPVPGRSKDGTDNTGAIVGGTFVCIIFALIVLVAIVLIVRRRKMSNTLARAQNSNSASQESALFFNRRDSSSVFIVNPIIINNNGAPPPYPGPSGPQVSTADGDLPPYSSLDFSHEQDPHSYTPLRGARGSTPSQSELPPPYSPKSLEESSMDVIEGDQWASTDNVDSSNEANNYAEPTRDNGHFYAGARGAYDNAVRMEGGNGNTYPDAEYSSGTSGYCLAQPLDMSDYEYPPPAYEDHVGQQDRQQRRLRARNRLGAL